MGEGGSIYWKVIAFLIVGILLVILILQNKEAIEIGIFFWSISAPKFVLLIISFVMGVIIGWVLSYAFLARKKRE